ncbi:MAG: hypothetical protein DWQ05_07245 [Calditrichaeota bacterium]|nr:MAG: hypothetical protein DWQ05_07245 [Calditrichota bacterium]
MKPNGAGRDKKMIGQLSKLIKLFRDGKGQIAMMALYNYIPSWLFRYINFYIGYTGEAGESVDIKILRRLEKRYSFRFASIEDLPLIQTLFPGKNIENIRQRFERKDVCILALEGEKCVGMSWLGTGRVHEESKVKCSFRIQQNCVWVYDAFIAREHRSRGVYLALGKYATMNSDFDKYYGFMVGINAASLKTHQRLGAIIVYKMKFISFLGITLHSSKNILDATEAPQKVWSGVFGKPIIIGIEQEDAAKNKPEPVAVV